jgi:hypothetical protein
MDGDFNVRADAHTLSQSKAIKRLEYAFMMLALTGYAVVKRHCEQISSTAEWTHASEADSLDLFNGGTGARA